MKVFLDFFYLLIAVLWIWIQNRMDPYHFGNLDPHPDLHPHKKIRIRIRIAVSWIRNSNSVV
jgi:hypothetical protein